jgi:hypothetical protein
MLWIFYDHLIHWCSFGTFISGFGITHQEKSGNPALESRDEKPRANLSITSFNSGAVKLSARKIA